MTQKENPKKNDVDEEEKEIEWDIEDMKRAIIDAAEEQWDKFAGG
tara:strand:- start:1730 stop:1864 length:135 start_codon:yes stop_codon:yes gene_type:complete